MNCPSCGVAKFAHHKRTCDRTVVQRIRNREYNRRFRENHRDRLRKVDKQFYERHKDRILKRQRDRKRVQSHQPLPSLKEVMIERRVEAQKDRIQRRKEKRKEWRRSERGQLSIQRSRARHPEWDKNWRSKPQNKEKRRRTAFETYVKTYFDGKLPDKDLLESLWIALLAKRKLHKLGLTRRERRKRGERFSNSPTQCTTQETQR